MSGFMKMQCWQDWIDVDAEGNEHPRCFCDGTSTEREGWFAMYSAPGYMDRTEPVGPFETATEAVETCFDLYGDPEDQADLDEYARMHARAESLDAR